MKTKFTSSAVANALTEEAASEIATRFNLTLDDVRPDFNQANEYGQQKVSGLFSTGNDEENARLRAEHAGRYNDATFLFESYCAQYGFEQRAEARDYARYETAAFGGRYGQSE